MLVQVKASDIIEFVKEGEDCRLEIDRDGDYAVMSSTAAGYDDTILTQEFSAHDYEECESENEYIDWLENCYYTVALEATNGEEIKIEITK